jgi:hypothetical protein
MASQINPNNINGAYPVAGQDNDSQGFRDNFTNTQTNFGYASAEITDLQNKVILKAPLDGSSTYNNNMGGAKIIAAQLQGTQATVVELGTVTGSVTINYAAGHYQYNTTTTGSISLNFTNFPTAGSGVTPQGWVIVRVTISNTAHTLTLPSAVGAGNSADSVVGIQGINNNVITFAETGTYELAFNSTDGGASIYLHELTRPRVYFTNPLVVNGTEDLASAAAASLTKPTSYFSTATAETATLAAGTEGQIKVFAMYADSGDMVITVTNAGWKTSGTGTITFDTIGDACTLQYINSKWFCIGNNGAVFA